LTAGSIAEWNTLLAVQAGAAATLMGLVFVAVSINLGKIITISGLTGRAAETILQFLEVFFISTVALIPRQPTRSVAIEFLIIGLVFWTVQIAGQIRYLRVRAGHPWSWFVSRAVACQFATVPFCVAGASLLYDFSGAFYWLVLGFIFSFAAGVLNSWVLLVEILR